MSSDVPQDFVDMARALSDAEVEYVVVGAFALAANGYPRATRDIDFLVRPSEENARKVLVALRKFGAPVAQHGITEGDFAKPGNVYQIGVPPIRIDILTQAEGVTFDEVAGRAEVGPLGPVTVPYMSIRDQIRNKRATGRTKDTADAEALEAILANQTPSGE